MLRHARAVSILSLLLAGACAAPSSSSSGGTGGGGGKADSGGDDAPGLVALDADEAADLWLAASVTLAQSEVLDTSTATADGYHQEIKLFCTESGSDVAPLACYVGVLPLGEIGGAYKLYRVGGNLQGNPDHVAISVAGAQATLAWTGSTAVFTDTADYQEQHYTVTLGLSGDTEDPTVALNVACTGPTGAACENTGDATLLGDDESADLFKAAATALVQSDIIDTSTESTDGYHQEIKLFCTESGSDVAPIACYYGVLPLGEIGGAYKLYLAGGHLQSAPTDVAIRITGAQASVSWVGSTAVFTDTEDFQNYRYTVTTQLSGDTEDPAVANSWSADAL